MCISSVWLVHVHLSTGKRRQSSHMGNGSHMATASLTGGAHCCATGAHKDDTWGRRWMDKKSKKAKEMSDFSRVPPMSMNSQNLIEMVPRWDPHVELSGVGVLAVGGEHCYQIMHFAFDVKPRSQEEHWDGMQIVFWWTNSLWLGLSLDCHNVHRIVALLVLIIHKIHCKGIVISLPPSFLYFNVHCSYHMSAFHCASYCAQNNKI